MYRYLLGLPKDLVVYLSCFRPGPAPRLRRSSGAFTLIELLVVIVVIAILSGLLFSAGRAAIESAKAAACAGNLRTLGAAITSYSEDHNGCLPFGYCDTADGAEVWTTYILPYLPPGSQGSTGNNVLYCPSTSLNGTDLYQRNRATWDTDYTCNAYALKTFNESHLNRLSECGPTTILLYDGCGAGLPGAEVQYPRHNGGLNCLFADGHVDYLKAVPEDADSWEVPPP
jgi:prepilin-type processing-associated H-X9-DG protein/prepilin-type N-terminal cleavage/methylation domain-containing protein